MSVTRPLYDDYLASKSVQSENIDVPSYFTASYSSALHSIGSFETYGKARTPHKWLRVHKSQEWHDLHRPQAMEDLQKFYDHFAKGVDNGWEKTPKLRLSLLAYNDSPARSIVERPEPEGVWPLPQTQMRKFYLDASTMTMSPDKATQTASTSFESHHLTDAASFELHFDRYTELSGLPKAQSIHLLRYEGRSRCCLSNSQGQHVR